MFAAGALFAAYFPIALWLKYSYVPPQGPPGGVLQLVRSFQKFDGSGFAFKAPASKLNSLADTQTSPRRSPLIIYEDGKPLGPAHSLHADVSKHGNGRFSHWNNTGFIFSTSDNSDPNLNGREYWAVLPGD
jgi:hypothetical protein